MESLLNEGESLSEFIEDSVRASVLRRRNQAEFLARGLRSLQAAHRTGAYVDAESVGERLQRKLDAAHGQKSAKRR